MLRQLFIMLLVSTLGFGLAIESADARRMGGGSNMGSVSRSADRPAATQQAQNTQKAPAGAAASRGGMGGMMGGLLAGGLLAALFFGGAFDGLRLMDFIMIIGVAALAFIALRAMRAQRPATAAQGHAQQRTPAQPINTAATSAGASSQFGTTPEWFDKERFLSGAKEHFMTLQRAWDNNDFTLIQEYVTPELYNLLREERAQQPANNRTEVVRLFVELGNITELNDRAEATVIFHGILEENDQQTDFNETWHLTRSMQNDAPWYLQGIEQNPSA